MVGGESAAKMVVSPNPVNSDKLGLAQFGAATTLEES